MASLKLLAFTFFISLVLTGIGVFAVDSISDVENEPGWAVQDSGVLEQLKSTILGLEYHIEEKTREIKDKDAVIAVKEKTIKEKLDNIVSLESEIASLNEKGNSDAMEQVAKAHARASELEKQVQKLKTELDMQIMEKKQLEARILEAKKRTSELNLITVNLHKIIDEQNLKLRKTERALQIAEEEMMKAKFEVASKTKELMEVHGAWFPPWLAVHIIYYQSVLEKNWKVHGQPALELLIEKKAQAEEWAAPHVEIIKSKWVPAMKEKWIMITSKAEPHVQVLTAKTSEIYEASRNAVTPHYIKVVELLDPYFQELWMVIKPYIDQVVGASRPHVDSLSVALKPYTKEAIHAYGKFLGSATTYHNLVQDTVHEKLKSHELTKPLATKELVWFTASALLALPFIFLLKIWAAVFCKNSTKIQNGNSNSSRQ